MTKPIPQDKMPLKHEAIAFPDILVGGKPAFVYNRGAAVLTKDTTVDGIGYAAKSIKELFETCLGPTGMFKMMVGEKGFVRVSKDGGVILNQIQLNHPVTRIMKEMGLALQTRIGDGVLSSLIICGKLTEQVPSLRKEGASLGLIAEGFSLALEESLKWLDRMAAPFDLNNYNGLKGVYRTVIDNNIPLDYSTELIQRLAKLLFQKPDFDVSNIYFRKAKGGSFEDSRLVKGVVFMKESPYYAMPERVRGARIAVLKGELNVNPRGRTEQQEHQVVLEGHLPTNFVRQYKKEFFGSIIDRFKEIRANVVIVEKGIDPVALGPLARLGILAIRRFSQYDLVHIAETIGAKIALPELVEEGDLALAESVEMETISEHPWWFIDGCKKARGCEVLLRGFSDEFLDEAETSLTKAIYALKSLRKYPRVVPAGGAMESFLAHRLRRRALKFENKLQLVLKACAEALEEIPGTLAENSGVSRLDTILELGALLARGEFGRGFNPLTRKVQDMLAMGLVEPFESKKAMLATAFETAVRLSRIDQSIFDRKLQGPEYDYTKRLKGMAPERMKKVKTEYGLLD